MSVRFAILASWALLAGPAMAQSPQQKAAQAVSNWDVFLQLYPRRALAAKEEGPVGFVVRLNNKGDVVDCQVTHSSGHRMLDDETCKLITSNAVFKPDPDLSPSQTKTHEGIINWKLPASLATPAPPKPVLANNASEKVVCKKSVRTGTLAGFERTCMTQRELTAALPRLPATWLTKK